MHSQSLSVLGRLMAASVLAVALPVAAQTPPTPPPAPAPPPSPAPMPGTPATGTPGKPAAGTPAKPPVKPGQPKPYADVITKEAKTQEGLFKVHRVEEKFYFEIPSAMMNRDMLWSSEVAELPGRVGYPGMHVNDKLVRWTRRKNKVFLRTVDYSMRAGDQGGIARGVEANSIQPIVMAFNVEAENDKDDPVIDVTSLFSTDPAEFTVRGAVRGGGVDPNRSYVDRMTAFPTNIETRSLLTFTSGAGGGVSIGGRLIGGGGSSSVSALVHYSLTLLPEKPMLGRYRDGRVGYFADSFSVYGSPKNRVEQKQFIARFRLEKKDPNAALSEPVRPIIFYLSREVPEKWRPWLKKGVEDWQVAFEQAGFKNAILCKDAPTREQDPNWDPEDARYNVIRWAPSPTQNAMGPHVSDPRSGEIINAKIIFWHGILNLLENWYFSQVSPLDPRARKLPFPDDLMGELVQYVAAHEVGHTLGLEHNFKSSSFYTVKQLRDPAFTQQHGVSPSIMDYSRFNYVAQPGDGARLIGKIGDYDKFAIEWGYKPIPGAQKPEDETPVLDAWAARQVTHPALRFGNYENDADPTEETEDLGSDPIEATRCGLKNIARAAKLLLPATVRLGEDYSLLAETYGQLHEQRSLELLHVARLIGGVVTTNYHGGRGRDVFQPVPAEKQAQAVRFLVTEGLMTPKELMDPAVLNRIQATGTIQRATNLGRMIISSLLAETRIRRILDQQAAYGPKAYSVEMLVSDLTTGVWKEVTTPRPLVDVCRRDLQRAYLSTVDRRINGPGASETDLKPLLKARLRTLARELDRAGARTSDRMTKLHFAECRKDIERILAGKSQTAGGGSSSGPILIIGAQTRGHGCFNTAEAWRRFAQDLDPDLIQK